MYSDGIKKIINRSEKLRFYIRKDTGVIYSAFVSNTLLPNMSRGITWLR